METNIAPLMGILEFKGRAQSKPEEHGFICPFCALTPGVGEDKKGKLWINTKKEQFQCWRCGTKGTLKKLYGLLRMEYDNEPSCLEIPTNVEDVFKTEPEPGVIRNPEKFEDISVDIDLDNGSLGSQYLLSRSITEGDIDFYGLKLGIKAWAGRIIIPIYNNGVVDHWTGRTFVDHKLRYKNSVGTKTGFFNLDSAKAYDTVVITEGAFSAIACGRNAIAIEGKSNAIAPLLATKFKEYIVCLDGEAVKETAKVALELDDNGKNVFVVKLPDNLDPADIGRAGMKRYIGGAQRYDRTTFWLQ